MSNGAPVVALASRNPGKLREIRSILASVDVQIVSADEFPGWEAPPEDAPDYVGNALLKARSLASFAGVAALADDSGIEVDALAGEPGPRSARFAGEGATDEENLSKLVSLLEGVPARERTARYRCVAVLALSEGGSESAEGTVEGTLITEPRGRGGFGYDPIFVPLGYAVTMAELAADEKDAISHRGKAFRGLVPAIERLAAAR